MRKSKAEKRDRKRESRRNSKIRISFIDDSEIKAEQDLLDSYYKYMEPYLLSRKKEIVL